MPDYEKSERIAIKMDSGISESEAIRQTEAEYKSKQIPYCIQKANELREKMKLNHAEKMAKKSTRFNYK